MFCHIAYVLSYNSILVRKQCKLASVFFCAHPRFPNTLITSQAQLLDTILPSAILATSRRQNHALKTFLCNCIQGLLCSGTKTQKSSDLSTILLPGLSGRSTATCRTNCPLASFLPNFAEVGD